MQIDLPLSQWNSLPPVSSFAKFQLLSAQGLTELFVAKKKEQFLFKLILAQKLMKNINISHLSPCEDIFGISSSVLLKYIFESHKYYFSHVTDKDINLLTSNIRSYFAILYSLRTFVLLGLNVATFVVLAGTGHLKRY